MDWDKQESVISISFHKVYFIWIRPLGGDRVSISALIAL